jgi:hypothetical protein
MDREAQAKALRLRLYVLCSECAYLIDLAEGNRPQRDVESKDLIRHAAEVHAAWLEDLDLPSWNGGSPRAARRRAKPCSRGGRSQRAQCYQRLADLLQRDELDGLRDATTIGQLASIRYELDGSGRIKIESKESARQRGVRSPDRADALMLALGNHRPEITMKDLLILPKRAQGGAYTYGIGDDNGIDDPKPRRYERADRPGLWKWWRAYPPTRLYSRAKD